MDLETNNSRKLQYSTAKAGIIGLTRALAIEGKKYNIIANTIAPLAGTAMSSTIWSVFHSYYSPQLLMLSQDSRDG